MGREEGRKTRRTFHRNQPPYNHSIIMPGWFILARRGRRIGWRSATEREAQDVVTHI